MGGKRSREEISLEGGDAVVGSQVRVGSRQKTVCGLHCHRSGIKIRSSILIGGNGE